MIIFSDHHKIRILTFKIEHLTPRYISWLNDKEVVRYSELRHNNHTYDSCYQYWLSYQNSHNYFWAIEIYKDGKWLHIGNINAYININNKLADVGILIGEKEVWGKGYGLIAWRAVCHYLLTKCNMRKVTGGTMSANIGMLKIMQRAGMVEDGKRLRQYICEGQEVDICHYALTANTGVNE